MTRLILLILFSIGAAAVHSAVAQSCVFQGTVSVSIGSGPGERLPGATVNLTTNSPGKSSYSAVTNEQGEYKFNELTTGVYTLQVALNGFKQHTETVTIGAGATTKSVALEVEGVSASVTVMADGDDLKTADTSPHRLLVRTARDSAAGE